MALILFVSEFLNELSIRYVFFINLFLTWYNSLTIFENEFNLLQ
jgi:hypothetical protein